jgi:exonuclease V gamma subunit
LPHDIDLIALDKGEIKPSKIVDQLIDKMEQYANFGFDYIKERLEDDPNYFFKDTAFLRVFLSFLPNTTSDSSDEDEDELEEL